MLLEAADGMGMSGAGRAGAAVPASVVGEGAVTAPEVGSLPGQRGIAAGGRFVELDAQPGALRQGEAVSLQ